MDKRNSARGLQSLGMFRCEEGNLTSRRFEASYRTYQPLKTKMLMSQKTGTVQYQRYVNLKADTHMINKCEHKPRDFMVTPCIKQC